MTAAIAVVCILTFLHYVGAQMRGPVLSLYAAAHYGAIAVGPFLGGLVAEWAGYRAAFVASAIGITVALAVAHLMLRGAVAGTTGRSGATFADVRRNASVWAGWIASLSGLFIQGVVFPFFPLLAYERGLGPAAIGVVFLTLGLTNTAARFPAGWLIDSTRRTSLSSIGGILA